MIIESGRPTYFCLDKILNLNLQPHEHGMSTLPLCNRPVNTHLSEDRPNMFPAFLSSHKFHFLTSLIMVLSEAVHRLLLGVVGPLKQGYACKMMSECEDVGWGLV